MLPGENDVALAERSAGVVSHRADDNQRAIGPVLRRDAAADCQVVGRLDVNRAAADRGRRCLPTGYRRRSSRDGEAAAAVLQEADGLLIEIVLDVVVACSHGGVGDFTVERRTQLLDSDRAGVRVANVNVGRGGAVQKANAFSEVDDVEAFAGRFQRVIDTGTASDTVDGTQYDLTGRCGNVDAIGIADIVDAAVRGDRDGRGSAGVAVVCRHEPSETYVAS